MAAPRRGSDSGLEAQRDAHWAATHVHMRSFADDARPRARRFGPRQ
jgi:hypothetical protein